MPLFKRKKAADEPPQDTPQPPVTVILHGAEGADKQKLAPFLTALPPRAEIALAGNESPILPLLQNREIAVLPDRGLYHGRYVVRVSGAELPDAPAAAALFEFLLSAQEDAVFFGKHEKGGAEDPLTAVLNGMRSLPEHCAVRRGIAEKAAGLCAGYAETFAPLLFAESAVSLPLVFRRRNTRRRADEGDIVALLSYFDKAKPLLAANRYRFAFRFVCTEWLSFYGKLAAAGDKAALADLDIRLKKENMAVWVALAEEAPLHFVRTLRKRGYRAPLPLRAMLGVLYPQHKKEGRDHPIL